MKGQKLKVNGKKSKVNELLNVPGWNRFNSIAKRQKFLIQAVKQSKLWQYHRSPIYKFGFEVPKNHTDTLRIDALNKSTRLHDTEQLELEQIDEYDTFIEKDKAKLDSKGRVLNAWQGYKKIRAHFVFDIKHDRRHKARLVANGHLTEVPKDSVYSSVVSLQSLHLILSWQN